MRIVFVTDVYFPSVGGVEMETRRLARILSENGQDVWIITASHTGPEIRYQEGAVKVIGIKSSISPFYKSSRVVSFPFAKKSVSKILSTISPDVIHIQTGYSLAKAAGYYANKHAVACIATGHYAVEETEYIVKNSKILTRALNIVIQNSFKNVWKNVDFLTVPSKFSKFHYDKLIKDRKIISVVSNGIDTGKFLVKSKHAGSKKTLLYVGRLERSKNVESIVRAMPLINKVIKTKLIVVGDGSEAERLKALATDLGVKKNVVFTGFATEEKVREIYKKADVFVTASYAENQPITVLEAMAAGLPVVASNVGGIPELIDNGENGFLFNPANSKDLAKKIIRIFENKALANKMMDENFKKAKSHDIDETVYKMEALYQKAIAINTQRRLLVIPLQNPHRLLPVKLALAVFLISLVFRWMFVDPSVTKAKGIHLKPSITNSKLVKNIQTLNLKLKNDLKIRK